MTREDFLMEIQEILQVETKLSPETNLLDLDEWDSLAMILTISFLDEKFGVKASSKTMQDLDTIEDIMKLAHL